MRFLPDSDEKAYRKARKRLERVTPAQRLDWADTSLWAVQEGLDQYRTRADAAGLQQARLGILGVLAAVDSLLDTKD